MLRLVKGYNLIIYNAHRLSILKDFTIINSCLSVFSFVRKKPGWLDLYCFDTAFDIRMIFSLKIRFICEVVTLD